MAMLSIIDFLVSGEKDSLQKEKIRSYYRILSKYENFLIDYIGKNEKWELTTNSKEAFQLYAEIKNDYNGIIDKYNGIMSIDAIIRNVNNIIVDKIVKVKTLELDEKSFTRLVSNTVVAPYKIFGSFIGEIAKSGATAIAVFLNAQGAFDEYSIKQISDSVDNIKSKSILNEEQTKELEMIQEMIKTLDKKGLTPASKSGGCFGVLLLLAIPISALLFLI